VKAHGLTSPGSDLGGAPAPGFQWPVRVYWEDTDAGGIVFYANYLKFFERARTEWLRQLGLGQQTLREQAGGMFVVSDCSLHYRQSARLDDVLLITASPLEIGKASLTMVQRALLKPEQPQQPPTLLCEGSVRIGWVDATTLRPQRMPAAVLQRLQAGTTTPST
jgi:acyl-CoA thioester hydrolase